MNAAAMTFRGRHPRRTIAAVTLLALLGLLTGLLVVAAPGAAATSPAKARADRYERALVSKLNRARSARGLSSVRVVPCVDKVADEHAALMRRTQRLARMENRAMVRECRRSLELSATSIGRYRPAALVQGWLAGGSAESVLLHRRTRWVGAGAVFTRARGWHVSLLVTGRRTAGTVPVEESAPTRTGDDGTADGPGAAEVNGMSERETAILDETNRRRARHGLSALQPSSCAAEFAGEHAASMARSGGFAHADVDELRDRCGGVGAAENLATGAGALDAAAVVRAWMDSSGHRANILDPDLTHLGVGIAKNADGRWYVAQDFLDVA